GVNNVGGAVSATVPAFRSASTIALDTLTPSRPGLAAAVVHLYARARGHPDAGLKWSEPLRLGPPGLPQAGVAQAPTVLPRATTSPRERLQTRANTARPEGAKSLHMP